MTDLSINFTNLKPKLSVWFFKKTQPNNKPPTNPCQTQTNQKENQQPPPPKKQTYSCDKINMRCMSLLKSYFQEVLIYINVKLYFVFPLDIIEGMVNKGIYVTEKKGVTFLFFGSYQNSCISNPEVCGPEG